MDLFWLAASYLLGSIPSAFIVAKAWKRIDIREYGSGNVGGANTWTHVSFWAFVLVGLADGGKGVLAVAIGQRLGLDAWTVVASGWAAIIGHNWSVFLRGTGGRGLAPFIGALLVLGPREAIAFLLSLLIGHITRTGALLAFFVLGGLTFLAWALGEPLTVIAYILGAFILHIAKRVWGSRPPFWQIPASERKQVLLNRMFLDQDTRRLEDLVSRKQE